MKKHLLLKTALLLAVGLLFPFVSRSQEAYVGPNHEIGLRFSGLQFDGVNSFSAVYKKKLADGTYRRITGALWSFNLNRSQFEQVSGRVNAAFTFGKEKRRPLGERTLFFYGPEGSFGVGFSKVESVESYWSVGAGFGYVLGVQHAFTQYFAMNLEFVPGVNLDIRRFPFRDAEVDFSSDFSNFARLGLMYCF